MVECGRPERERQLSPGLTTTHRTEVRLAMAENQSNNFLRRASASIGVRYGFLIVSNVFRRNGATYATCTCDCGATSTPTLNSIKRGTAKSCGCKGHPGPITHGELLNGKTSEYGIWSIMKERCQNPHNKTFARYGGRGITVCDRWQSFANFLADMGRRPSPQHSIERIDNAGPYSPDNCKWATRKEQGRNKRNNVLITFNGETLLLIEWAERTGIRIATLRARIYTGWSPERAITAPVRKY